MQYRTPDTSAGDNQIKPHFNIVNRGSVAVPRSELIVRYWYTIEEDRPQQFWCDYAAPPGCGTVTARFVRLATPRPGADTYLELGFTAAAGSLAAGAATGEIQARFNKDNWAVYNENGDHSYDPTKATFVDWNRVTLYRNGVLVWGVEP